VPAHFPFCLSLFVIRLADPSHRRYRRQAGIQTGYTLYETLITLVILGILSGLATGVPGIIEQARIRTHVNLLVTDLALARSESIKRGRRVTLCQSPDGIQCGRADRWEQGWIIFSDLNENRLVDDADTVIRVQQPLRLNHSLIWRGSANSNYYVSYFPTGLANKSGTFSLCGAGGAATARTVTLYRTGRARTGRIKWDGAPPDCPAS